MIAVCATTGRPDDWFSDARPGGTAHAVETLYARRICVTCPSKLRCHKSAAADPRLVGIFGGLDEQERRSLARTGTSPADYGYCPEGVHLALPENTSAHGKCLPCRRVSRAGRTETVAPALPLKRRTDGRFAKAADLALEAA